MRKNYKHYLKEVTNRLNENPPVSGYEISEKEVEVVLKYFIKNMIQVIQRMDTEVIITRKMYFFPVRRAFMNYKARIRKKMNPIYRRLKYIKQHNESKKIKRDA